MTLEEKMSAIDSVMQSRTQAKLFDFALMELICENRESFQPLWTIDSWVKLLIWMSLNSGLSGDKESLELFVEALGPQMLVRMRRLFFERNVNDLGLKLMGDPAEQQVLIMPITDNLVVSPEKAADALTQIRLADRVVLDRERWQILDSIIAIPWAGSNLSSDA